MMGDKGAAILYTPMLALKSPHAFACFVAEAGLCEKINKCCKIAQNRHKSSLLLT